MNHTIFISGMRFAPSNVTVEAGDTVRWENRDGMAHTIEFDRDDPDAVDIPSDSGQLLPGHSFDAEFSTSGTYKYHCGNHPSLKGVIVVS